MVARIVGDDTTTTSKGVCYIQLRTFEFDFGLEEHTLVYVTVLIKTSAHTCKIRRMLQHNFQNLWAATYLYTQCCAQHLRARNFF